MYFDTIFYPHSPCRLPCSQDMALQLVAHMAQGRRGHLVLYQTHPVSVVMYYNNWFSFHCIVIMSMQPCNSY